MKLHITQDILEAFPGLTIGVIVARDIDNRAAKPEVMTLLRAEEARIAERIGNTALVEHPHITPWREAYRWFGAKASKYPSSIENLIRRNLKGEFLPAINTLVDVYNTVSLRYLLSVGGEDMDRMDGDLLLTRADDDAPAIHLLGEPEARPPAPGEVIYTDNEGAICRRWNWKEAERTKLTQDTRNAVLVVERLPPIPEEMVFRATADLAGLVETYCGGRITTAMLDRDNPETVLRYRNDPTTLMT